MNPVRLPASPLADLHTIELTAGHEALLQRFFDRNPAYFVAVGDEPAGPNVAHEEIHGDLPAGWACTRKWVIGYANADGELEAMANVVTDLLVPGIWHIGLFIVATARHGSGDAHRLHGGIEAWARANGATWLRLGVVSGNAHAERFWRRVGYVEVRTRDGLVMGRRVNTVRVMLKPLAAEGLDQYLERVPRDRPGAA